MKFKAKYKKSGNENEEEREIVTKSESTPYVPRFDTSRPFEHIFVDNKDYAGYGDRQKEEAQRQKEREAQRQKEREDTPSTR